MGHTLIFSPDESCLLYIFWKLMYNTRAYFLFQLFCTRYPLSHLKCVFFHCCGVQGLCWYTQLRIQRFSFKARAPPGYSGLRIRASIWRQVIKLSLSLLWYNLFSYFLFFTVFRRFNCSLKYWFLRLGFLLQIYFIFEIDILVSFLPLFPSFYFSSLRKGTNLCCKIFR